MGWEGGQWLRHAGVAVWAAAGIWLAPNAAFATRTVVTISFDEERATQWDALPILDEFGMKASFFINSNWIGRSGRLTWAQVRAFRDAGHEIGGHTLDHVDLVAAGTVEATRQVCADRAAILAQGFDPVSFSYPFGSTDAATAAIVGSCGYRWARSHGGIWSSTSCTSCPKAEPIPPPNPLWLRSSRSIQATDDLAYLQERVLAAETTGGWINVNFHDICDGCNTYATKREVFRNFLAWLAPRAASHDTVVLPMGRAFVTDTSAPNVVLVAPLNGETVGGAVTLTAEASDDVGVARVEFWVDGALVATDVSPPYEATWDSTTAANDVATIVARAIDGAGKTTLSSEAQVLVDHVQPDGTPPSVAITAPAPGATVSGTVTISANASDDIAVARVEFLAGGVVIGSDSAAPYEVRWDTTPLASGAILLTARAIDGAGNAAVSTAVQVLVDHAPAGAPRTVVTISFDDERITQVRAFPILDEFGVKASFFINSSRVGESNRLTWAQIRALRDAGHEIGGHTLDHVDLAAASSAEATRQVCDDRAALVAQGFDPKSFAYPFGSTDADAVAIVGACGYNLARSQGGIWSSTGCTSCPKAESIPPPNRLWLRSSGSVKETDGLANLQGRVLAAETTGGWININLHDICDGCDTYSIKPELLREFLAWLMPREASHNTVVVPMGLAFVTDTSAPAAVLTSPADGETVVGAVNLAAQASDDVGVARVEFRVNGSVVATDTTPPYGAAWDSTSVPNGVVTIVARATDAAGNTGSSTEAQVLVDNPVPDRAPPSVAITSPAPGSTVSGTVSLSASASDNVAVARVDFLAAGVVIASDASAPYQVSWNTTTLTNGTITLSARAVDGAGNGALSTDVQVLVDNPVPDGTPPSVALTSPAPGATISGTVSLAADASDNVAVARVDFLLGGVVIASDASAPFQASWDTATTVNGTATLAARAVDAVGNAATSTAITVNVANPVPIAFELPFQSFWSFWDADAPPKAGWFAVGFDDSAWGYGQGELGYGDGDEKTVLRRATPSQPSVYFRSVVTLPGTPIAAGSITIRFDDGYAIYVNGTLLGTMNTKNLDHASYGTANVENMEQTVSVPAHLLHAGANTLAVMIKQTNAKSDDLSFDLRLRVTVK